MIAAMALDTRCSPGELLALEDSVFLALFEEWQDRAHEQQREANRARLQGLMGG